MHSILHILLHALYSMRYFMCHNHAFHMRLFARHTMPFMLFTHDGHTCFSCPVFTLLYPPSFLSYFLYPLFCPLFYLYFSLHFSALPLAPPPFFYPSFFHVFIFCASIFWRVRKRIRVPLFVLLANQALWNHFGDAERVCYKPLCDRH